MTKREVMQMALDVLEVSVPIKEEDGKAFIAAFRALRAELAKSEPEPVAWMRITNEEVDGLWEESINLNLNFDGIPLYRNEDL